MRTISGVQNMMIVRRSRTNRMMTYLIRGFRARSTLGDMFEAFIASLNFVFFLPLSRRGVSSS